MKKHVREGLKRATATWACYCMLPMGSVVMLTCAAARTTMWTWAFWGVAAAFLWALVALAESFDCRRRHGSRELGGEDLK